MRKDGEKKNSKKQKENDNEKKKSYETQQRKRSRPRSLLPEPSRSLESSFLYIRIRPLFPTGGRLSERGCHTSRTRGGRRRIIIITLLCVRFHSPDTDSWSSKPPKKTSRANFSFRGHFARYRRRRGGVTGPREVFWDSFLPSLRA